MQKRIVWTILLVMIVTPLLFSGGTKEKAGIVDDLVKVAWLQEPASLDPNNSTDGASFAVNNQIYEGLLKLDGDLQILPSLAESYDISPDGLVYTFYLRKGVTFHNGEKFTAEDVKYSMDRCVESSSAAIVSAMIDSTTVVDPFTVEIRIKNAYGPMLQSFASPYLKIVNRKAVEEAGEAFKYAPGGAGTGPYRFVSWTSGEKITLEAYENYWGDPVMPKAEIIFMTDSTARLMAVENGDVHFAEVDLQNIPLLEKNKNTDVIITKSITMNYVGFTTTMKPFDDYRVRQAVAYSVDKEELLIVSREGLEGGSLTPGEIVAGQPGYDPNLTVYPRDIEKAKELLIAAGYPNGFKTKIYTPDAGFRKNIATYLQASLAEIGISAEIIVMQQAALLEEIRAGRCDIWIMGYSTFAPDPDMYLYPQYHTGEFYNFAKYSNSKVDELLERGRLSSDFNERDGIYREAMKIIYDDVPVIPNYYVNKIYAISSKFEYVGEVLPYLNIAQFVLK